MRCFVACELPESVRTAIGSVVKGLADGGRGVRWVAPGNLHLTLKFLGELDESRVPEFSALMRETAGRHAGFDLEFSGMGTFPERGAPRVVWIGTAGDVEPLGKLVNDIEEIAERVGVAREKRPFAAHVTIGRVRDEQRCRALGGWLKKNPGGSFGRARMESLTLFRSDLTPTGSVYTPVEAFRLT